MEFLFIVLGIVLSSCLITWGTRKQQDALAKKVADELEKRQKEDK